MELVSLGERAVLLLASFVGTGTVDGFFLL